MKLGSALGDDARKVLGSVGTVLRGNVLAQIVGILLLPLLSRLFPPTAFGHYQLFQSILAILLIVVALRYELAILQARPGGDFANVFALCIVATLALTLSVTGAILLLINFGPPSFFDRLPFSPFFVPLALLAAGIMQTLSYVLIRQEAYSTSSNARVVQSIGFAASATAIGIFGAFPAALIVADLVGRIAGTGWSLLWRGWRNLALNVGVSVAGLLQVARTYARFPLMSMPGGLMNTAGSVGPAIFIYAHYDAATSGQFALVDRACAVPVGLIVASVAQVFTAQFAREERDGGDSAINHFSRLIKTMAWVGLIPTIVLAFTAPALFAMIFGEQWKLAGQFTQILAPMFWTAFFTGPINMALVILNRQDLQLQWEFWRLAGILIALGAVSWLSASSTFAVFVHSAINIIANLAFLWLATRAIRASRSGNSRMIV